MCAEWPVAADSMETCGTRRVGKEVKRDCLIR
jgi:hypothetical protein